MTTYVVVTGSRRAKHSAVEAAIDAYVDTRPYSDSPIVIVHLLRRAHTSTQ